MIKRIVTLLLLSIFCLAVPAQKQNTKQTTTKTTATKKQSSTKKQPAAKTTAKKQQTPKLTKRQQTKYSLIKKWWFGFAYFCACYFLKGGILDGKPGFVFARGKWKYFANIRRKILTEK